MGVSSAPVVDEEVDEHVALAGGVDEYVHALPQFKLDIVRTGQGAGPSKVWLAGEGNATLGAVTVEFPMLGHFQIPRDEVAVISVTSAPESARWAGVDLEPGMVMLYGPGMHHTGISPVGFEFTYATFRAPPFEERVRGGMDIPGVGTASVFSSRTLGKSLAAEMEGLVASSSH